jgi:hypothetical protein
MIYSHFIGGIFWLVFGFLLSIWSTNYHIGSLLNPGPGFLPLALGLILILLSFILLFLGLAKKPSIVKETVQLSFLPGGWKKVAYTVLILLFATFLFEPIGYLITIFLFIVFLMLGAEFKSWKKIIITALLTALGVYLVFVLFLEQPLPRGLLRI